MYRPFLLAACAAGALLPFAAAAQHHHAMPMHGAMPSTTTLPKPARAVTQKTRGKAASTARAAARRHAAVHIGGQTALHDTDTATPNATRQDPAGHTGSATDPMTERDHASMNHAAGAPSQQGSHDQADDHARMDHTQMDHMRMDHAGHTMPSQDGSAAVDEAAGHHMDMHATSFTAPPAWRRASDAALAHAPVGAAMSGMTMGTANGWYAPGSGTARLPAAEGPMRGAMFSAGEWMVMAHGYAWGTVTDQGGPRGDDMAFVQSMAMLMADRDLSDSIHLQLRGMGSLEPLMGRRGYPNLFATGETANGVPLVDRQHPHDLFMELAARLDYRLGGDTNLFLYGGPVGEPALGT